MNLEELLRTEADNRPKLLREIAGCELTGQALEQFKLAKATEDVLTALGKKISGLTPYVVPRGGMFLQPTDERRRSGSDYTPRSLTEPIVRTTLRPIFERLGEHPRPQQILDLKICDPAMGSGAFLVEACRFLGDRLVEAWNHHKELPTIPADEEPSLYARRVIAQRCLYGVDKNPFAVDLAKLSLWLATLAEDHPFATCNAEWMAPLEISNWFPFVFRDARLIHSVHHADTRYGKRVVVRITARILRLPIILGVVAALFGCGSYDLTLERKFSSDGQFWAELTVNRSSAVAGGEWYWISVGKAHPTWRDEFTRNERAGVCSLEGPGNLSVSWTGARQLQVLCANCRQDSFFPVSKEWEGVSIQYVFK